MASTSRKKTTKLKNINKDTIKVMQDGFLRCALCQNMLDEPKCLDCLHKFCAKCLTQYITVRKTLPGQKFSCPNRCELKTELPREGVSGLRTDDLLVSMGMFLTRKHTERQNIESIFGSSMSLSTQQDQAEQSHITVDYDSSDSEGEYTEPVDINQPIRGGVPPDLPPVMRSRRSTEPTLPSLAHPQPPIPPPRTSLPRTDSIRDQRWSSVNKHIAEVSSQIAVTDQKIKLCQKANIKFNEHAGEIMDEIERQEKVLIQDLKRKSENMKKRALEILESEQIKLQRTLEETKEQQKQLQNFKHRAEIALNVNDPGLESARLGLPSRGDLERPVQELTLAVERAAQRETPMFNLIVQKTALHVRGNTTGTSTTPRHGSGSGQQQQQRQPQQQQRHKPQTRLLREKSWYVAASDDDEDEASDVFLGQVTQTVEKKINRVTVDSGIEEDPPTITTSVTSIYR